MTRRHLPLLALLALQLALGLAYGRVVPVFEAPDEHTHYFVAQHIAHTGRLPLQSADAAERGPAEQEASQPPLYYALVAPLIRRRGAALDEDELWYNHQNTMGEPALRGNENRFVHPADPARGGPDAAVLAAVGDARVLSALLGLLTTAAAWALARRVFVEREALALAAAAVVGLNPQLLHLSGALSNDMAIIALSTAALALLLRLADGEEGWGTIAALALVVGLAPLAKLSGLALLGFAGLTVLGLARRARAWRLVWRAALPMGLAALALSGWWYLRNLRLYGSLTGIDAMLPEGFGREWNAARFLAGLPAELLGLWRSSVGIYGWFTVMLPEWLFLLLAVLVVLGLGAALGASLRPAAWVRWPRVAWLLAWWGLVFLSLLRWLTIVKGAHGRLLFPALAAPAVLLVIGWRSWLPGRDETRGRVPDAAFALAVAGGMLALALYALLGVIRPAYALPATIAEEEIPASAVPVDAVFDERLRLVAVELPERAAEEGLAPVTLYWQALEPIARDGFVALRVDQEVAGEEGVVSGDVQLAYPGAGALPPSLMEPGDGVVVDRRWLRLPSLAARADPAGEAILLLGPGLEARVNVHVYDPEAGRSWPLSALAGEAPPEGGAGVDVALALDARSDMEWTYLSGPDIDRSPAAEVARFGDGLALHVAPELAAALDAGGPAVRELVAPALRPSGKTATALPLLWRVDAPPGVELARFAHLVDESGVVVAQFDGPPASHGRYPSTRWKAGELVPGTLRIELPPEAEPGDRYTLLVGLYRLEEGAPRLPATDAAGARLPDDALALLEIEVAGVPPTAPTEP